jgi:hypothetical protein
LLPDQTSRVVLGAWGEVGLVTKVTGYVMILMVEEAVTMNTDVKETMRGRRVGTTLGRRPILHEARRVCTTDGCDTVLSRYNPRQRCRVHAVPRYPRLRGKPLA